MKVVVDVTVQVNQSRRNVLLRASTTGWPSITGMGSGRDGDLIAADGDIQLIVNILCRVDQPAPLINHVGITFLRGQRVPEYLYSWS